ncbi:unnamed protein product [Owenia fusiformis]|uniref:Uncharacterized protein n=1 Tax=Owenia fusiformis TaxID=6347 RepID=A0A8J1TBW2_OWEFU|nr:unnamed protein product [Owenia fusiformis]
MTGYQSPTSSLDELVHGKSCLYSGSSNSSYSDSEGDAMEQFLDQIQPIYNAHQTALCARNGDTNRNTTQFAHSMNVAPQQQPLNASNTQMRETNNKTSKKRSGKTYKHIPHSEKAPQVVAKRNARERRRVQAVNGAFIRLRRHVPYENKHKRLSKVKTLRFAIEYIHYLKTMIHDYDDQLTRSCRHTTPHRIQMAEINSSAKENNAQWLPVEMPQQVANQGEYYSYDMPYHHHYHQ